MDNCSVDPNCLTRRIVDNQDPSRGTDYVPVPDTPEGDGSGGADSAGNGSGGGNGSGNGAGEAGPSCTPRPAGRVPPSFAQVEIPRGAVGANPRFEHLTGLESWFWYDGPTSVTWASPVFVGVTAACEVIPAPPPVTYRADLAAFTWRIDDGRPGRYDATRPGNEQSPAVRHVYETKGTWTVAVDCTWRGGWGGQTSIPCAERSVSVIEVRSGHREP